MILVIPSAVMANIEQGGRSFAAVFALFSLTMAVIVVEAPRNKRNDQKITKQSPNENDDRIPLNRLSSGPQESPEFQPIVVN